MMQLAAYAGYFISIAVLIILAAYFEGMETAIVSSSRMRIEFLARKNKPGAVKALGILDNMEDSIGALLIGNNIVSISAASFITYVATKAYSLDDTGLFWVSVAQMIIFLIFCAVTPKVLARAKAESFMIFFSGFTVLVIKMLNPLARISLKISDFTKRLLKLKESDLSYVRSRDELKVMFSIGKQEGVIDRDHHLYVSEMLSFKDLTAIELMTPAIDIVSADEEAGVKQLVYLISESGFSRIPIYREKSENIIGYVYYRDILKKVAYKNITELMRPPVFIPSTKNVLELYLEMQKKSTQLVFVVNEYGAVVGMITYEDIVEEVVGEIHTSDHSEHDLIVDLGDKRYLLAGNLAVDYLSRLFSLKIDKKGFETIAGFMAYLTGRIPRKGERITYRKFIFLIEEATDKAVVKIIMTAPHNMRR